PRMPGRLMAGRWSLEPSVEVRILPGQVYWDIVQLAGRRPLAPQIEVRILVSQCESSANGARSDVQLPCKQPRAGSNPVVGSQFPAIAWSALLRSAGADGGL